MDTHYTKHDEWPPPDTERAVPMPEDKITVWQELDKLNKYCQGLDQRLRETQDELSKLKSDHHRLDSQVGHSGQKFDRD